MLVVFIRELRKYFARDQKEKELDETLIEGDVVDIERDIAEEKARQEDVRTETDELVTKAKQTNKKETK